MNEQYSTKEYVDETDREMNSPIEITDPLDEQNQADTAFVYETPLNEAITHEPPVDTYEGSSAAQINRDESEDFRMRWNEIQSKFVDEPRSSVQQADALVCEVIDQITKTFTDEHRSLEGQWNNGNDASTEDLRKTLQRYRSFFNRLVA